MHDTVEFRAASFLFVLLYDSECIGGIGMVVAHPCDYNVASARCDIRRASPVARSLLVDVCSKSRKKGLIGILEYVCALSIGCLYNLRTLYSIGAHRLLNIHCSRWVLCCFFSTHLPHLLFGTSHYSIIDFKFSLSQITKVEEFL